MENYIRCPACDSTRIREVTAYFVNVISGKRQELLLVAYQAH
ncbi:hypothetical protein AB6H13_04505 [Providencia vermicola]